MSVLNFKLPHMIIDGKEVPAPINVWANITLTGDELTTCLAACDRQNTLLTEAVDAGLVTIMPIIEQVPGPTPGTTITAQVGLSIFNSEVITGDPVFLEFDKQYRADTNVKFRD